MLRLTVIGPDLVAAPLDANERMRQAREALAARGIYVRRWGYATSTGITITYAHLSQAADAPAATEILAGALPWEETDVADVASAVAVTTYRG